MTILTDPSKLIRNHVGGNQLFGGNQIMMQPTTSEHDRRLTRSRNDRILGGVCGGIGRYLAIDPILVRLVFVLGLQWRQHCALRSTVGADPQ